MKLRVHYSLFAVFIFVARVQAAEVGVVFKVTGTERQDSQKKCPRAYLNSDCVSWDGKISSQQDAWNIADYSCKPNLAGRVSQWQEAGRGHLSAYFICAFQKVTSHW